MYEQLLQTHRNEMILQMQALVIPDEPIRRVVCQKMWEIRSLVLDRVLEANLPNPEQVVSVFMANGMLCNVAATLHMPELKPVFVHCPFCQ